jgi:predicted nucleic acid-binding protein
VLISHSQHRRHESGNRTGLFELIFIDSDIPMYLAGASHPHKTDAQLILENLVAARERLVCDAEVLQEILHRYVAIARWEAITQALNA